MPTITELAHAVDEHTHAISDLTRSVQRVCDSCDELAESVGKISEKTARLEEHRESTDRRLDMLEEIFMRSINEQLSSNKRTSRWLMATVGTLIMIVASIAGYKAIDDSKTEDKQEQK